MQSNKLWKLVIGHKGSNVWIFGVLVVLSFSAALLEGVSFGFFMTAFSGLHDKPQSHLSQIKDFFFPHLGGVKLFLYGTLAAVVLQISRSALCYLTTILSTKFAYNMQTRIQSEVYRQILRLSYATITRHKIGDLLERAGAPVHFVNPLLEGVNRLIVSLLTSFVIIAMMCCLDWRLTIITISLFAIFAFLQKSLIHTILRASDAFSKYSMEANQDTAQVLQGIKVIQIFSQQENFRSKITQRIKNIGASCKKIYMLSNIIPYLNEMISVFVLGLILISATVVVGIENESFLATLMTFLLVSYRLSTRLQIAVGVLGTTSIYFGYLSRVNEILEDKDKQFTPVGGIELKESIQEISLEGVSFRYHTRGDLVHKDISFTIRKGMMVGIVGLSGSGKTSLSDLLLRLYEPTQGKILVNGLDVRTISIESWRSKFGVVTQDAFLFDESIEENIRFGLSDVTFSQIREAAQSAGAEEFIDRLPQKYHTVVGERGFRLSGGERQRIALARALLRDPEILMLDEATSSLDSQSEYYIQKAIENVHKRRTVIVIAHRLSTVVNSDAILVIERGSLIEQGTHEQLLESNGRYANLWELQTNKQNEVKV